MKYSGSLYASRDKKRTIAFYKEILGLRVIMDFNTNFTFTGGISFQTTDSWAGFIEKEVSDIHLFNNAGELYFETEDLDDFIKKLKEREDITYLHPLKIHAWGQRVIRFYDPDGHIIEVAETLTHLCVRLKENGLTDEEISNKTMLPEKMVKRFLSKSR